MIRIVDDAEGSALAPEGWDLEALAPEVFGPSGVLPVGMEMEHRPEQAAMALAVGRAFGEGESLLFEAGTGVGKSLAYLVPGVVHAVTTNRPFVVATNTISLQEQLLENT